MSKRQSKPQASSSRALPSAPKTGFGGGFGTVGPTTGAFGSSASSLSYLSEQPDLNVVSDPNVVVNFKNLSKKDSTTKAKALEDLQSYVTSLSSANQELEDGFLDAWKTVYPRASIDVSRRVRQSAHSLHGQIYAVSGKRVARYMPSVIGPWIAGIHDNDKAVARAAFDALQIVFPTQEKQSNLNRIYQSNILEFAQEAALEETAETLTDERTTTKEDSDAKYYRVVSSALAVVSSLLSTLPDIEAHKQQQLYKTFITSDKTYEFFSAKDASVRRAVLRLFRTYLAYWRDLLSDSTKRLGDILLSKAVLRNQSGSSLDFVELLTTLSSEFPSFWTSAHSGKTSLISRLSDLVKTGSQSGPPQYWASIAKLFDTIDEDDLPSDVDQVVKLTESLHTGIGRKDEPRSHAEAAWSCYISVLCKLIHKLSPEEQQQILQQRAFPLIRQYLLQDAANVQWSITGSRALPVITKLLAIPAMVFIMQTEWSALVNAILEHVQTSAPEQSKEYDPSQRSVIAEAARLFSLQNQIIQGDISAEFSEILYKSTAQLMNGSQEVLKARHGKPYGAAGILEVAVRSLSPWIFQNQQLIDPLMTFLSQSFADLITSASRDLLIALLYECKAQPQFNEVWDAALTAALDLSDVPLKVSILRQLLGSPLIPQDLTAPADSTALQDFLITNLRDAIASGANLDLLRNVLEAPTQILSTETAHQLLSDLTDSLSLDGNAPKAMAGLEIVARRDPKLLKAFLDSPRGGTFMQTLLLLTESGDDEIVIAATTLTSHIEDALRTQNESGKPITSSVDIIQRGLSEATLTSLSVDTLVDLAERYLSVESTGHLNDMLPDATIWTKALGPFLNCIAPQALAITNVLSGAIYLAQQVSESKETQLPERDREGLSIPLRIAQYMTKLFSRSARYSQIEDDQRGELHRLLCLTIQLAVDNVEIYGANFLWRNQDSGVEADILEFISEAQQLVKASINDQTDPARTVSEGFPEPAFLRSVHEKFFEASSGFSIASFHNARAYAQSISERIETHGWQARGEIDIEGRLKTIRRSRNSLSFASFLVAFKMPLSSTPALVRICNELVAELTGTRAISNSLEVIQQLVCLNLIIQENDQIIDTVARQRLIFFIQHVAPWLEDEAATDELKAELSKTLTTFLPHIKDIYGTFWTTILDSLDNTWSHLSRMTANNAKSATIPAIHASLKLVSTLQKVSKDVDSNDDVKDAWRESRPKLISGLLALLKALGQLSDETNLPLQGTNDLLGRVMGSMPVDQAIDIEELYSLMGATSQRVQRTAFEILHSQIPLRQEQISIDVALEKSAAHLPEELLSLIIEAPTLQSLADTSFERSVPPALQGYLSSWLLIFDHFERASEKVKADYTVHLKEGEYLNGLLAFTFDFLGHGRGKPIDASKFDAMSYSFGVEESPVKDVQWLLVHLYYLCLKRTPALTKNWWMECKSRQIVINVESWTEKYISPHIISDALTSVSEWAATQDPNSDEALIIKANQRSKEVTVSKEIDDQLMSLVIRLPINFPLGQAVLHGVNRVAVDEKKWRSWLLNSQGVITFSNNSLIDGIIAFRRNVVGALKGQTECAICYSIVGADKQLPTKRCATCKNLFHGSCLYRWFKTSNSSSCPLCRNPFNYT